MNENKRNQGNVSISPWTGLMDIQKSMNRLFSDLDFPWISRLEKNFDFAPSCEAWETDKEVGVRLDAPGIRKEDIKVEVHNNQLMVHGERKSEKTENKGKTHFSEIYYGSFERSFTLPGYVNADKVNAEYKDGVLTVRIPKTEAPKTTRVEIR